MEAAHINQPPFQPDRRSENREAVREHLFTKIVAEEILENFKLELEDAGLNESQVREICDAFDMLPEEDQRIALAYPASLRPKLFARHAAKIKEGSIAPAEAMRELLEKARQEGYTLGFHLSNADIPPGKEDWFVRGTEKDHRNDDKPMAYYSLDYKHRYKKKPSQYLYVIRADVSGKENSGHYQDNDGAWGRAYSLPIVAQIDMFDIEERLNQREKAQASERSATKVQVQ